MAKAAKKTMRCRFETDPDAPRLSRAASLLLGVLAYVKKRTIVELDAALQSGDPDTAALAGQVVLSDDDRALLADPDLVPILFMLKAKIIKDKRQKPLSVGVCPECDGWVLASSGSLGKCTMRRGCPGTPIRVVNAKRIEVDETEAERESARTGEPNRPGRSADAENVPAVDAPADGDFVDDGDDDPFA